MKNNPSTRARLALFSGVFAASIAGCVATDVSNEAESDRATSSATKHADAGADAAPDGGTAKKPWVSGYYLGYLESLYPVASIDWNGLTHVIIGPVVPNADGSLVTTFDIDPTNGPIFAKNLVALAHTHGKKATVMLGGAGAEAGWRGAAGAAHRSTFVANLLSLASSYGFDGFDLDWEPLAGADQPSFQALAQALRSALPKALLTAPVGWVNANFPTWVNPFYVTVESLFDQINIMSYGMAGPWPGWTSWHSSALTGQPATGPSSVESSVNAYLAAGMPAAKLGIGIGFFGSCWSEPVTGPRQTIGSSNIVAGDNVMTYAHILADYYVAGNYHWDATSSVPYLGFPTAHGPEACGFVSYEDPQSILAKGAYVKQKGLGGTIVWTINEGYVPTAPAGQRDPLMAALQQGFLQ